MLLEDEDLTALEPPNEFEGHSGANRAPWAMPKEQLQQWKRNRRALVSFCLFPFCCAYYYFICYEVQSLWWRDLLIHLFTDDLIERVFSNGYFAITFIFAGIFYSWNT